MRTFSLLFLLIVLSVTSTSVFALQGSAITYGNLSVGKFYTYSTAPDGTYPDLYGNQFSDGSELTNESLGEEAPVDEWVGWNNSSVDIVLDLGKDCTADTIKLHCASKTGASIYFPASIEIYTQPDGSAVWTKYGSTLTPPADTPTYSTTWLTGDGGSVSARKIKYVVTSTVNYTLIDEIEVHGDIVNSWRNVPDWGCYNGAYSTEPTHGYMDIDRFESFCNNKRLSMVLWYQEMNPAASVYADFSDGLGYIWSALADNTSSCRYMTVGWLPDESTAEEIAQGSGTYDEYFEQWFTESINPALRNNNDDPIWIRPMNEMNGGWTFPGTGGLQYGGDPLNYRRAWRRMYNIAEQVGATDKHVFVWALNGYTYDGPDHMPDNYYPGDQYVDWVGVDVYPQGTTPYTSNIINGTAGVGSFDFYGTWPHKPLMIAEGGWDSALLPGEANGIAWINDWFDTLINCPRIKAAVWYNGATMPNLDLLVQPAAVQDVFKARVADDYFLGKAHAGILDYNGDSLVSMPDIGAVANQWKTSVTDNLAVAHGDVTYTIDASTPPSGGTYDDNTGDDLANGYVSPFELTDPDWVGFYGGLGYALLTFDLGEIYELSSVDVTYMVYMGAGIWAPENIEVSFSTDGASYTSPITLTGFTEFEWQAPTINFSISGNTGRYVKIKVNANDYRTDIFTFLSEFNFTKFVTGVPADINGDDLIEFDDLKILTEHWLN